MTTDDKPVPFPIGPSDTFNGVPWKNFCSDCRTKLDAAMRSGLTSSDICVDCAAMIFDGGRVVATEISDGESPGVTSVPVEFVGSELHVPGSPLPGGDISEIEFPVGSISPDIARTIRRMLATEPGAFYQLPADPRVAALRAELIEALTLEMGPRMARAAVLGPDISAEDAETYTRATGPINLRHVSLNRDGTFTLAYEEGAMDPKPKEQHPPPWRWDKYDDLVDANGEWVASDRGDDRGEGGVGVSVASEYAKALIAAAPDLRDLVDDLLDHQARLTSDDWIDPWVQRASAILDAIDAAAKS